MGTIQKNNQNYMRFFIIFILLFFAMIFYYLYREKAQQTPINQNYSTQPVEKAPTIIVVPKIGSLFLEDTSSSIAKVGRPIIINVYASSSGRSITGYDLVFNYAPNLFDVSQTKSLLEDFKVFPYKKADMFVITGTKSPSIKSRSIFENTKIAALTIIPKKSGRLVLSISSSIGFEKTQFIDETTTVLYPNVNAIPLEIQ